MKNFTTVIMALGAIYILKMNQSARAVSSETASPTTLLARGGGSHGGSHGYENRGDERAHEPEHRGESYGEERTADHDGEVDHPPAEENRVHTLNKLQQDKGLEYGEGWTGVDGGVGCSNDPSSGLPPCNGQ